MLLALGPTLLDAHLRAVVIGVVDRPGADGLAAAASGADGLWFRAATPEQVADACTTGLPVGVTAGDVAALRELVAAGAVAVECDAPEAVELAASADVVLWCGAHRAVAARGGGVVEAKLVVDGCDAVTIDGTGPAAWGAVVQAVRDGVRVVRTTDPRSVRRVVTVTDRLRAARTSPVQGTPA